MRGEPQAAKERRNRDGPLRCIAAAGGGQGEQPAMEDLLIRNVNIIDGTGAPAFRGSLAVRGERIHEVWRDPNCSVPARETVDGMGRTLSPGFVDTHTHSDLVLLHDGRQPASITQGVTTEILGQDGLSYAPLRRDNLRMYAQYLEGIDGRFEDVPFDFASVREYRERLNGKIGVNAAYLVPHCALRLETAGFENRLLTAQEMKRAQEILVQGLLEGAKGLSTGLSYFPGAFSDTQELVELCSAMAPHGGVYVTHLRTVFRAERFDNVEEALEIARRAKVKLHFSHYRTGGGTIGHAKKIMEKIDRAHEEGLDLTLELYPYPYGASYAPMLLPPWASAGGVQAILHRLNDEKQREAISAYIEKEFPHFDGMIAYAGRDPSLEGSTFRSLAEQRGETIGRTVAELLRSQELALSFHDADPQLSAERQYQFEEDVLELLSRPYYMVGSDAIHLGGYPHPRAWGAFARLLRIAREHAFPLETMIERMTDLPCRRFGLADRGRLQKGYFADMVLFDPDKAADASTVEEPRKQAVGFLDVWVNGCAALRGGVPTGALAGRSV